MRPRDVEFAGILRNRLLDYSQNIRPLAGIESPEKLEVLIEQLLESYHRVQYIPLIRTRDISPNRADPHSEFFDPEKAAIINFRNNNIDEAFWMVFLSVYFGKNKNGGWRYARDVYGSLGGELWTWVRLCEDIEGFKNWFGNHHNIIRHSEVPGGFGNHRKYESMEFTGSSVQSYVEWVGPHHSHQLKIQEAVEQVGDNPKLLFNHLYISMSSVVRFGRTGKFDYLTMIGKQGLANIAPGSTYMAGATGPYDGGRLLFSGNSGAAISRKVIDAWLVELDITLQVGMQVIEDSLCNWQKSPTVFVPFRG